MTLEEAIKHCEEVAEENEKDAEQFKRIKATQDMISHCYECAEEHRQLAEWLRALKEIWDSGDCNDCLHQNNCTIRPQLGQMVRYNCYQYERKIQNDNADN